MTTLTMDPSTWDDAEIDRYLTGGAVLRDLSPAVGSSDGALLVGTTGPFAQLAGRHALELGGSAVDAALVTSFAQIALAAGSWVSYAGILSLVHYDAATGEVRSLNGGFRRFLEEDDPLSIPTSPEPSGRTALVPGFFAAAWRAHQTYGRLSWADLLAPAIFVAEQGFLLDAGRVMQFEARRPVISRTPEGRATFMDGEDLPKAGDIVRQPLLASTLRHVATDGVDYLYRGDWAQHFVDIVRREGGKATLADLESYDLDWVAPARGSVNGFAIFALGEPDYGGVALIEGLHLLEEAGVRDPCGSGEDLYWFVQVLRQTTVDRRLPTSQRLDPEHARATWKEMAAAGSFVGPAAPQVGSHSDCVAVVDHEGNAVALTHSINTGLWGSTGIFVDGISIPDAACFQQQELARVAPGGHLPAPTNPSIVLRNGELVLASSSIGAGLVSTTLQCVAAVLAGGVSVADAVQMPLVHGLDMVVGDSINTTVETKTTAPASESASAAALAARLNRVTGPRPATQGRDVVDILARSAQAVEDGIPSAVIDGARERGQALSVRSREDATLPRGYWAAVSVQSESPRLQGGRTPFVNGRVEGV